MRHQVLLSTDGACKGNTRSKPCPGGYAGILQCGEHTKEYAGFEPATTNNRMELRAVVEGIRLLRKPCVIIVQTDSHYVCTGIAKGPEWASKGWKLHDGRTPANVDLWKELQVLTNKGNHVVRYQYVKGHDGNEINERCDKLAKEQITIHVEVEDE